MPQPYTLDIAIRPRDPQASGLVELELVLTNRSNGTARFGQSSLVFDWQFELTAHDGSPVAMTRYGEEGRRAAEGGPPGAVLCTLAPGEQLKATIPLHQVFKLIVAGRYRLVVSRSLPAPDDGSWIDVRSAPLEFALRD